MLTTTPPILTTHSPPKIKRMALLILDFFLKYLTRKYVPTKHITNTRPTNIEAKPKEIRYIAIYWIKAARVVQATRNPDVPDTT